MPFGTLSAPTFLFRSSHCQEIQHTRFDINQIASFQRQQLFQEGNF